MKTSLIVKWLCHVQWILGIAVLCLASPDGRGYYNNIRPELTSFSPNGELSIPEKIPLDMFSRMITKCPEEILRLPIHDCMVLDFEDYLPEKFPCFGSEASKQPIALQFKRLEQGTLPPILETNVSVFAINADEGGFTNLTKTMLQNYTNLRKLSFTKHWFEKLKTIDHIFSEQKNLIELHLENNGITSWSVSDNIKDDVLKELKILSLSGNPIEYLSDQSLIWLKNSKLETFILRDCKGLMNIDSGTLLPVSSSLLHLDLSRSGMSRHQLQNITNSLKNNSKLEALGLAQMGLTLLPVYIPMTDSLKILSLYGNSINFGSSPNERDRNCSMETECFGCFSHMEQLQELDMRANGLKFLPCKFFQPLSNLKKLLIGENEFFRIDPTLFLPLKNLTLLTIACNRGGGPEPYLDLDYINSSQLTKLEYLDMSCSGLRSYSNTSFMGLTSLKELYLSATNLMTIPEGVFSDLKNLKILDISRNTFGSDVGPNAFAGLTSLEELRARSCALTLTNVSFNGLHNITRIDLTDNNVERLDMLMNKNMSKLSTLILTGNKIVTWQEQIFEGVPIQELIIDNNLLNEITPAMRMDFENITHVDASKNPYQCYCSMYNLSLSNLEGWPASYVCQTDDFKLIKLERISSKNCMLRDDEKSLKDSRFTLIISVVSVVLLMAFIGFCYWKWWHILVCARILHRTAWFSIVSNEIDAEDHIRNKKYFYDVFVSYSDPDRQWILDHLLPNLEINYQIKVCLHERDFKAGLSVLENIMACMEQSHCILLVVSKAFMKSHWCQFELNMAQHRLLEMKRDHLLLVLLEPIPREQCTKMMRYLMLSKTYLQWPSKDKNTNKQEQQLFWRRLRKAIGCPQDITQFP